MCRLLLATVMGLAAVISLVASGEHISVRRDTQFPVELRHTLKAASAKIGDPVEFRTAAPVLIGNNIVVPEDSVILGTVIEVRHKAAESPRSLIRIRIHTLKWKNGETGLNAMVSSVLRPRAFALGINVTHPTTFLEGIRVVSHQKREAYTEFFSDERDVSLRSGVSLLLRQIDPEAYPDRDFNIFKADNRQYSEN